MNIETRKWLESQEVSMEMKLEIEQANTEVIDDMFSKRLKFGTAGIRGIMGPGNARMNIFLIRSATEAYAAYIKSQYKDQKLMVLIGHDNRRFSKEFTMEAANVFTSHGIYVKIFRENELRPTPYISYLIPKLNCVGGLIITASHNPKEYNGYKVYNHLGGQLLPDATTYIQDRMEIPTDMIGRKFIMNEELISYVDPKWQDKYISEVLEIQIHPELDKKLKVLYTPLHGAGSIITPKLFGKAGYDFEMVKSQSTHDPDFGATKSANPESSIAFEKSREIAAEKNIEFMLGADPDADRIAVAVKHNGEWNYMSGNEMGALYLNYMIKEWKELPKNAFIVSTFVSTDIIYKIARKKSIPIYKTPTGFKWICDQITKVPHGEFILGFEEAIGATIKDFCRDKDSHQAGLLATDMANFYKSKGMTLIDALHELCAEYGQWYGETVSLEYFGVNNWVEIGNKKMAKLAKPNIIKIDDWNIKKIKINKAAQSIEWYLDGDSWVKFRMSGTEPKFKLYFEIFSDKTRDDAKAKKDKLLIALKNFID